MPIGTHFGGVLTAEHCVKLGLFALEGQYYTMAIQWFEFAKELVENRSDKTVSEAEVLSLLQTTVDQVGMNLSLALT